MNSDIIVIIDKPVKFLTVLNFGSLFMPLLFGRYYIYELWLCIIMVLVLISRKK